MCLEQDVDHQCALINNMPLASATLNIGHEKSVGNEIFKENVIYDIYGAG